jgi:signal transduction histidine kinase
MTEFMRSLSLKSRVMLVVFVLLIGGIWGLATRIAALVQADIEQVLLDQLSATVGYAATDLDNSIRLRVAVLNEVAAAITPELLADPAEIRQLLEQRRVSRSIFPLGLIVANREGVYIADYPAVAGRLGASVRDSRFFLDIMGGARQAVGSPVIGRTAKQALFRVGVPLHDASGKTAGVLFGAVLSSDPMLFGEIERTKIGKTGYFLVLSPKDKLIVSATDKSRILQPVPAKGLNPLLDRRMEQGFDGPGRTVSSLGTEVLTVSRHMSTTGWVVLAAIPTEEVFAPVASLKNRIYLTALLLSLALLVILRLVLARQLAPLKTAGAAMRRMTEGHEPLAPIPVARDDEIGELIGNFNRLAAERGRQDASLRNEIAERRQAQEELGVAMKRLRTLSEHIRRTQDGERRRIAYELHEELGQELATLKIQLQMLQAHCQGEEAQIRLEDARMVAEIMLERVRAIAFDLHPPQLDDFGLCVTLRRYCAEQADKAGWAMHFSAAGLDDRPVRELELACFRIAQEALANVASHASATEVWVSLRQSADELQLRVRDNGVGFDTAEIQEGSGARSPGLSGLEERVRQAGGRIEFRSTPGGGTEVYARFSPQRILFPARAAAAGAAATPETAG